MKFINSFFTLMFYAFLFLVLIEELKGQIYNDDDNNYTKEHPNPNSLVMGFMGVGTFITIFLLVVIGIFVYNKILLTNITISPYYYLLSHSCIIIITAITWFFSSFCNPIPKITARSLILLLFMIVFLILVYAPRTLPSYSNGINRNVQLTDYIYITHFIYIIPYFHNIILYSFLHRFMTIPTYQGL